VKKKFGEQLSARVKGREELRGFNRTSCELVNKWKRLFGGHDSYWIYEVVREGQRDFAVLCALLVDVPEERRNSCVYPRKLSCDNAINSMTIFYHHHNLINQSIGVRRGSKLFRLLHSCCSS
jgi:hypothetical protein